MIMDCEDHTIFTNAMELHYINMKAFAKAVNEADSIIINETKEAMFTKWLSVITEKEIANKAIIETACSEEEIYMAISALARQSEDKLIRQAYLRRQDEIYFYNKERADDMRRMEQLEHTIAQERHRAEQAEAEIERLRKQLATIQDNQ